MRIPQNEYKYHQEGNFRYVTFEMVEKAHTPEEVKNFKQWMSGQTTGVTPDGLNAAIYSWDYERWVRQGRKTQQCSHDWD